MRLSKINNLLLFLIVIINLYVIKKMNLVGAALLFPMPLVMIYINRIKPLQPCTLLRKEHWVILCSFVLAFTIHPTPKIIDQLMLAGPIILSYQIGIGMLVLINRDRRPKRLAVLRAQDAKVQAERLQKAQQMWQDVERQAASEAAAAGRLFRSAVNTDINGLEHMATAVMTSSELQPIPVPVIEAAPQDPPPARPTQYLDSVRRPIRRNYYR